MTMYNTKLKRLTKLTRGDKNQVADPGSET